MGSLQEFIAYFFITILLTSMVFQISVRTKMVIYRQLKIGQLVNQLTMAQNFLARDLMQAGCQHAEWKKMNEDNIIWQVEQHALGWHVVNGNLYRSEGSFDQKKATWQKKKSYCAATHIRSFIVTPVYKKQEILGFLLQMSCFYEGSSYSVKKMVALRQGGVYAG